MRGLLQINTCVQSVEAYRRFSQPLKLSYEKYGSETAAERKMSPLVILHGLFGQKANWRFIARGLHRRLKNVIFTLDLRNHGNSPWCSTMTYTEMAKDVRHFIDNIIPQEIGNFRPVHLLGHSMGGKIAMSLALMENSDMRLRSLIIEDIAPRRYSSVTSFSRIIAAMKFLDLSCSRSHIEQELAAVVNDRTTRLFLMMNLERVDQYTYRWRLNLDSIGHHLQEICGPGIENEGVYTRKCLFISGALSEYIMHSDHSLILKQFPNTQFSVISEAAHWVHVEKPHEFMDVVVKFICSVESDTESV